MRAAVTGAQDFWSKGWPEARGALKFFPAGVGQKQGFGNSRLGFSVALSFSFLSSQ